MSYNTPEGSTSSRDGIYKTRIYIIVGTVIFWILVLLLILFAIIQWQKNKGKGVCGIEAKCKHCNEPFTYDKVSQPGKRKVLCIKTVDWYHPWCFEELNRSQGDGGRSQGEDQVGRGCWQVTRRF